VSEGIGKMINKNNLVTVQYVFLIEAEPKIQRQTYAFFENTLKQIIQSKDLVRAELYKENIVLVKKLRSPDDIKAERDYKSNLKKLYLIDEDGDY
jgi:hypothetical protein